MDSFTVSTSELHGFYNAAPTLTASTFANFNFKFDLSYGDGSQTLHSRAISLEVYKR